jgi:hypothetical protein
MKAIEVIIVKMCVIVNKMSSVGKWDLVKVKPFLDTFLTLS